MDGVMRLKKWKSDTTFSDGSATIHHFAIICKNGAVSWQTMESHREKDNGRSLMFGWDEFYNMGIDYHYRNGDSVLECSILGEKCTCASGVMDNDLELRSLLMRAFIHEGEKGVYQLLKQKAKAWDRGE
jgi:hypothetical protein